jgi:hypothetical protein
MVILAIYCHGCVKGFGYVGWLSNSQAVKVLVKESVEKGLGLSEYLGDYT